MTLAFFSILNPSGTDFLLLYGLGFLIALVWSLRIRGQKLSRFNPSPSSKPTLDCPIEIGYLAGGPARAAEVALINLIDQKAIKWRKGGMFASGKIKQGKKIHPDAHWFERALYSEVVKEGDRSQPIHELVPTIRKHLPPLEDKLARLGLRPTRTERSAEEFRISLPFLILIVAASIRIATGLSRNEPIGYLLVCIILTAPIVALLATVKRKVTPAGEKLLASLKETHPQATHPALTTVALFGVASASAYADMHGIEQDLAGELQKFSGAHVSGSTGCGGSIFGDSGGHGGSGGCGGGCGGCGGD